MFKTLCKTILGAIIILMLISFYVVLSSCSSSASENNNKNNELCMYFSGTEIICDIEGISTDTGSTIEEKSNF